MKIIILILAAVVAKTWCIQPAILPAPYPLPPQPKPTEESCRAKGEYYIDGGPACQPICENLFKTCNIQTFAPVKACYCLPNSARIVDGGKCVQISSNECKAKIKVFCNC